MPRGFYSYVGLQEEVAGVGTAELTGWGGSKGTICDTFTYFNSEAMAEANDFRFMDEIGYSGTMDRSVKTTRMFGKRCEGSITFPVRPEGGTNKEFLGLLLKHAMCDVISGTYSGAGTFLHTISGHDDWMEHLWNIGTGTGCYGLTVHVGREDTNGTIRDYPYIGCRIRRLTFACAAGGELTCTVEFTGRLAKPDDTGLTPAYPTMRPFMFHDAVFESGMVAEAGTGGTTRNIDAFTLTIDNGLADNFVLGTQTLGRTTCGSQRIITGSYSAPFETWVRDEQQKWAAGTASGINIAFTNAPYILEFRLPNIYYTGNPPSIGDTGENVVELPFQATLKTTFDLQIYFVNTDEYIGAMRS